MILIYLTIFLKEGAIMDEPQKYWHFDPATERKASKDIAEPYQLLEATHKDKQKVVGFYQSCPVAGYEIGSVNVIYNRDFNQGFEIQMKRLQHRDKNTAFKPKWEQENNPQWRAGTNKKFEDMAKPYTDSDYPSVKLLPLWHGTNPEILPSIFSAGYAILSTVDVGFFGSGIYGAYEAEYSKRVYSSGALILNWVAVFSAYPVIDGDMNKLKGKGNHQNYDAHFIPVVPSNPHNQNEVNYFPCKPNEPHKYTEVVVFESSSCLPRYLVELQSNLPQPNKLNLINFPLAFFGKKVNISPEQQKTQDQLIDALTKGDWESIKNIELKGASFLYANKNGTYPLVAAVDSTDLEVVRYVKNKLSVEKAQEQWAKIDHVTAEEKINSQIPTELSKNPTYSELGKWYKKHSGALWCGVYDTKVLIGMDCKKWDSSDENWISRSLRRRLANIIYNVDNWAVSGFVNDENELYAPSLVIHNDVVKTICDDLNTLKAYVKTSNLEEQSSSESEEICLVM